MECEIVKVVMVGDRKCYLKHITSSIGCFQQEVRYRTRGYENRSTNQQARERRGTTVGALW